MSAANQGEGDGQEPGRDGGARARGPALHRHAPARGGGRPLPAGLTPARAPDVMRVLEFWGPGPDLARYLELPARLYAGDPRWVPLPRDAMAAAFSPANPFFQVGTARHFLALEGDRPVGRVTAIRNGRLEAREGPVGLLGFFECEPDLAVAGRLLTAAVAHLGAAGLRIVRAPVEFDPWHRHHFMIQGFDEAPVLLEPYNKPYYPPFFLSFGFREAARSFSKQVSDLPGVLERLLPSHAGTLARGFRLRSLQGEPLGPSISSTVWRWVRARESRGIPRSRRGSSSPCTVGPGCGSIRTWS